jgi:hypothetical protein
MKSAEIDGIKWWRTTKQLYARYLKGCEQENGASAAQVIAACFKEKALEQGRIEAIGRNAEDYILSRDAVKAIDQKIESVRTSVMNIMLDEGSAGRWLAIGRRGPDLPHELIPARFWPFLTIDIEKNWAFGKDFEFRQLRCVFTANIAKDHPLLVNFRSTNQLPSPGKDNATPSKPPPEKPDLGRNGAPGRPSYMHLVEAEFKRRRDAGRLEPSLTKEAAALAAWFRTTHPQIKPYTPKAICNALRSLYRAAKISGQAP